MFRSLLAHLQEALHKRYLVYCVRVMSVGCYQGGVFHSNPGCMLLDVPQPATSQKLQSTQLTPKTATVVPPEDGRLTPETCRGSRHNKVIVKVKVY
jgi:hypothetical protein